MQPLLTQVPPKRLRSTIATFRPDAARRVARDGPAWPVPMTMASKHVLMSSFDRGALCWSRSTSCQSAPEKFSDQRRDFRTVRFEREVSSIEQVDLGVRLIALEGLCTFHGEEWIPLAPNDQGRRPTLPEERLELGIEPDVRLIVAEQVELDVDVARSAQERPIEHPGIGAQQLHLRLSQSGGVLKPCSVQVQPAAQFLPVCGRRLLPIGFERFPFAA